MNFVASKKIVKVVPLRGSGFLYQSRGIEVVGFMSSLVHGIEFGMDVSKMTKEKIIFDYVRKE